MDRVLGGRQIVVSLLMILAAYCVPLFASADVNSGVEQAVRTYFADIPVMIEIARCESKFRQFNSDGTALHGGGNGGMVGVFQIYDMVHRVPASALGFDITTLEGNMGYARHLYMQLGTNPWNSAQSCWKNTPLSVSVSDANADMDVLLKRIETLTAFIAQLQQLLARQSDVAVS